MPRHWIFHCHVLIIEDEEGNPCPTSKRTLRRGYESGLYTLWEEDGRPEGRADEYWERARRFIEAEDDPKNPDMVADPPL